MDDTEIDLAAVLGGTSMKEPKTSPSNILSIPDHRSELGPLVVFDASLHGLDDLTQDLLDGAETLILAPDQDPIPEITKAIKARLYTGVQIVAHGAEGRVFLGHGDLHFDVLDRWSDTLAEWKTYLSRDAELSFYCCELAKSGGALVTKLSDLTGLPVSASTRLVGASDQGGS